LPIADIVRFTNSFTYLLIITYFELAVIMGSGVGLSSIGSCPVDDVDDDDGDV